MKSRKREREDYRHDDVIFDGGGCSAPPPPPSPPALRPPSDVMCKVFSQLGCDDLLSCSLVCKFGLENRRVLLFIPPLAVLLVQKGQWYRDSSEMRERWKRKYMAALAYICDNLPCNLLDLFYPSMKNELKRILEIPIESIIPNWSFL